jgi:carbonic anhydrase
LIQKMYVAKSSILSCLIHQVFSENTYYKDNGDSWAKDPANPVCGKGWSQSPIDLDTKMRSTEEKFFRKNYENIIGDLNGKKYKDPYGFKKVVGESYFSKHSSAVYAVLDNKDLGQTNVPTTVPTLEDNYHNPNWFQASKNLDILEADPMYFAKQLHFHTKSEHSINGELKDLEMHIVHQSPNTTADKYDTKDKKMVEKKWPLGKLAVIGVLFDTKNYDKDAVSDATVNAIDKFFDSLLLDTQLVKNNGNYVEKTVLPDLALGELMSTLNTSHRWIYNGSLTTPPCYEFVFWNVL